MNKEVKAILEWLKQRERKYVEDFIQLSCFNDRNLDKLEISTKCTELKEIINHIEQERK